MMTPVIVNSVQNDRNTTIKAVDGDMAIGTVEINAGSIKSIGLLQNLSDRGGTHIGTVNSYGQAQVNKDRQGLDIKQFNAYGITTIGLII